MTEEKKKMKARCTNSNLKAYNVKNLFNLLKKLLNLNLSVID